MWKFLGYGYQLVPATFNGTVFATCIFHICPAGQGARYVEGGILHRGVYSHREAAKKAEYCGIKLFVLRFERHGLLVGSEDRKAHVAQVHFKMLVGFGGGFVGSKDNGVRFVHHVG